MRYTKLPPLRGKLSSCTVEAVNNNYVLLKEPMNPFLVAYTGTETIYVYHILKIEMGGRGYCNGRYDLPCNQDSINRFYQISK
mgnify:CR=1 FL=1